MNYLDILVPGHRNSLQIWRLVLMPSQNLPPFKAWVTIVRVWSRVPPPQLFEHCVQLPYSLHTQSIGTIFSNITYRWLCCVNFCLKLMRPVCISYKIYLYKVHKTSGTLAELLLNSYHHYCTRTMSILDISYMAFRHISHHASWDHRGNLKNTPSTVIITRRLGTGYLLHFKCCNYGISNLLW